jgi:DNA-binding transcriptional MerR regulator
MYSIKDIENLTGIKSHTIRIWEQRYGLVSPNRTDSNIRFYDDEQMRILLSVTLLVNNGVKISKVAKMNLQERNELIDNMSNESVHKNAYADIMINNLIESCLCYDEAGFVRAYDDSVRRYGMKDAYIQIIYPMLVRLGLMWSRFDLIPAQEHFISNLLRMKFFSSINAETNNSVNETWVLFLPENEKHEIGLLFCYYLLRQSGRKVIYLGQNVPFNNIETVVDKTDADSLYFFIVGMNKKKTTLFIDKVSTAFPDINVYVSGSVVKEIANDIEYGNILFIQGIDEFMNVLEGGEDE